MAKIHNGANGPGPCNAKPGGKGCPFDLEGTGENHFDTQEEAQAAYDVSMESQHGLLSTVAAVSSSSKPKAIDSVDYPDSLIEKPGLGLSKVDQGLLKKIRDGKPVRDRAVDEFLYAQATKLNSAPNLYSENSEGRKLYALAKDSRSDGGAMSTLPSLDSFDPSTETVFSSKGARLSPSSAGKAIRREAGAGKWDREQSQEYRTHADRILDGWGDSSAVTDADREEARLMLVKADNREQDGKRSDVRLNAMLKEVKYLETNSEKYSALMDNALKNSLRKYSHGNLMANEKLGGVKPVKL